MKRKIRFLSLFSGIEAASVAWVEPLGWECVAVAEIEKFPCQVLKHHYPHVPNLGDVTKITREMIEALGHIDVVVLGFPCQDLSVAGLRKGLTNADGSLTRSGLFFVAMQIVEWSKARWTVGENVPGLFSSNEGRDFAAVVGELAGAEYRVPGSGWRTTGVALGPRGLVEWFVLDAQYCGLAQRRKRVFFVRDTSTKWRSRPPLFLNAQSLQWHSAPRREKGKRIATATEGSTGIGRELGPTLSARERGGGGLGTDAECDGGVIPIQEIGKRQSGTAMNGVGHGKPGDPMYTLQSSAVHGIAEISPCIDANIEAKNGCDQHINAPPWVVHGMKESPEVARGQSACHTATGRLDPSEMTFVSHALRGEGHDASEDGTGRGTPIVPVAGTIGACMSKRAADGDVPAPGHLIPVNEGCLTPELPQRVRIHGIDGVSPTLQNEEGRGHGVPSVLAFSSKDSGGDALEDCSPTLRSGNEVNGNANGGISPAVAFQQNQLGEVRTGDVAGTLNQNSNASGRNTPMAGVGMAVRRLTPRECEKLQGFPTVTDRVSISACFDHQKNCASVEIKCRRLPNSALPADEIESVEIVSFADVRLWNDREKRESLAAVHVRIGHEPQVAAIHSAGKLIWSVGGAEKNERYLHPILIENIAHAFAALQQGAESLVLNGEAESQKSTRSFILQSDGKWPAVIFGHGNLESAKDAASTLREAIMFITSKAGQLTQPCEQTERTWLCSALLAIGLSIHPQTQIGNSVSFVIDLEHDYTKINDKTADGPRYKALGNSMAVPVMCWIGQRIDLIDSIP